MLIMSMLMMTVSDIDDDNDSKVILMMIMIVIMVDEIMIVRLFDGSYDSNDDELSCMT